MAGSEAIPGNLRSGFPFGIAKKIDSGLPENKF